MEEKLLGTIVGAGEERKGGRERVRVRTEVWPRVVGNEIKSLLRQGDEGD